MGNLIKSLNDTHFVLTYKFFGLKVLEGNLGERVGTGWNKGAS